MTQRIAIVGSGISGLVTASLLSRRRDVVVYEAGDHIGGHTHTHDLVVRGERQAIDTGFIVFNHRTYPNFVRLLDQLGVASLETEMSFSVRCERTGLEYNGTSLDTLFAQRRNAFSPGFLGMIADILRFNREGVTQAAKMPEATVAEFVAAHRYGRRFVSHYLLPMGASIWSCPPHTFEAFPIRFVMDFFANHGMLQVHGRPVWRVVRGGSARYVEALTATFRESIRLRTPVLGIRRDADGVTVRTSAGEERHDEVVLACHADQALAMLEDPSDVEREVLAAFPYQRNEAILHTDASLLPRTRKAWAAWNYSIPRDPREVVTLSYNMNILQRLTSAHTFCVTLNPTREPAEGTVLRRLTYHHPIFTAGREQARHRHAELIRARKTSFCGAYWGYGFHEDGVNSALAVARAHGEALG
ncbi:MAG: FAD-dependent oxidoreductase [Candidatus Sericytochromatia bacterium]|nr:FAD-dependent oxidoreductase [Candidatus Sericytochromatia bacterium]